MPNENEYKAELSKYRLEKAQESLKYAKLLMDNNGYAEAVNRAYYAIFHATRAVLAMVVNKILCKPPKSGKIEITDIGGFKLWQEKITAN